MKPSDFSNPALEFLIFGDTAMNTWRALCDYIRPAKLGIVYQDGKFRINEYDRVDSEKYFEDGLEAITYLMKRREERLIELLAEQSAHYESVYKAVRKILHQSKIWIEDFNDKSFIVTSGENQDNRVPFTSFVEAFDYAMELYNKQE